MTRNEMRLLTAAELSDKLMRHIAVRDTLYQQAHEAEGLTAKARLHAEAAEQARIIGVVGEVITERALKVKLAVAEMINVTWHAAGNGTTIYEVLKAKIGREPTNAELTADVKRILDEGLVELADKGRLRHQRKR